MVENEMMEVPIVKDDPLEDLLLKEPELFNEYIKDSKSVNMTALTSKAVLTDNYLDRFLAVWPKTTHKQRRARCIKFLKQNPGMRTMDPEVLWQRIFYYHVDYGEKSRRHIPRNFKPIENTVQILAEAHDNNITVPEVDYELE